MNVGECEMRASKPVAVGMKEAFVFVFCVWPKFDRTRH